MKILLTGAAGFIGYHTARHLMERGDEIIGVDNINDYYEKSLKLARLELLRHENFTFCKTDICDHAELMAIFTKHKVDRIIHLAAQPGVRYSIENPGSYENSNISGTLSLFEAAKKSNVKHVVCASSSSVYGDNDVPFQESMDVENPRSVYAATKRGCELIGHFYSNVFGVKTTILRLFTVYGPFGRPDMALYGFTRNILNDEPIEVYNNGEMLRDFTYVSDIVDGITLAVDKEFDFEIVNLGASSPVRLLDLIVCIEQACEKKAKMLMKPMLPGEMQDTHADIAKAKKLLGFEPHVKIEEGVRNFVDWYTGYYR